MKTNKKTFRRIASLLLVLCFSVLALASCAQGTPNAADANGTHGSIQWDYKQDTKTLTLTGAGVIDDVNPEESDPWASVRLSAQKIVVGEGITSIGAYAFWGMNNVTEVSLPASLFEIDDYAFSYCGKLATVKIPDALNRLGVGAFEGCSALSMIYLPAGVTSVSDYAFAYCYSLKSAIVKGVPAEGALMIGSKAFYNCRALERMVLRQAVTDDKIAADALTGVDLTKMSKEHTENETGSSTVTIIYMKDGAVYNTVTKTLELYAPMTEATPTIEGYTADHLSISTTGTSVDQTFTVTYTRNEAPADTDAPETEPVPDNNEPKDEGIKPSTIIAIVIMGLVLAGIGVGAFLLIRSDKKSHKNGTTVRKNGKK